MLRILPIKAFWISPTVQGVNTHWLKVPVLPLSPSCFYAKAYGTEVSLKNTYSRGRQLEKHVACDMCEDQMRRAERKQIWELILPQGDAKCQCYSGQRSSSTTAPEPSLSYHLSVLPQFSVSWVIWCYHPSPSHGLVFLLIHSSLLVPSSSVSRTAAEKQQCKYVIICLLEKSEKKGNAGFMFTKVNVIIVVSLFREGQDVNFNFIFISFLFWLLLLCVWLFFLFGHLVPLAICSLSLCLYRISVLVPSVFPRKSNCPSVFVTGGI